jgi:glycine cleavage system H lipoate-binding protein
MKQKPFSNRLLALLIVSVAFIHASPARDNSPSGTQIRVLSDPPARTTSLGLINIYNQSSGLEPVSLETMIPSQFYQQLQREGTVALITSGALSRLRGTDYWSMLIGREVLIPVMNASHPLRAEIMKSGISPAGFSELLTGSGNLFYAGDPEMGTLLANFLGMDEADVQAAGVSDAEQLISLIGRDPEVIGFIPLNSVLDPEQLTPAAGISLVPIDLNGNGILEHGENIYRSGAELVRGITIGKYPRTLYTRLYAVTAHQPSSGEETAFLEWLAGEGQGNLSPYGWTGLMASERPTALSHINDRLPLLAGQQVAPVSSRAVLIICGFLLALVIIVLFVLNRVSLGPASHVSGTITPRGVGGYSTSFPGGLFFDRSHTWTYLEKNGKVKVGLDQFLLHVTGPVTRVELKSPGTSVRKGEPLLSIVQQGKKLVINAPVTGVVTACNESLKAHPDRLNESPYDLGWVYLMEPERWLSELRSYLLGDRYREWLREEMNRLKEFFSSGIALLVGGVPQPVIQDGGEISYGILTEFGPEVWEEFQERFINKGTSPSPHSCPLA